MSRKSLILCLSALAVLLLGLAVAIAVLYSGTGGGQDREHVSGDVDGSCFCAVPSDAVLVAGFARADNACSGVLSAFEFPSALSGKFDDGSLESLRKSPMAVSLHYSGKTVPLYVLDMSKASDEAVSALETLVEESGMFSGRAGDLMTISGSENLVRASLRHCEKGVSVADAPGFGKAASSVSGKDMLLIPNLHAGKLMSQMFTAAVSKHSSFVERVADWLAFDIEDSDARHPLSLVGKVLYDGDSDEFMSVLDGCQAASSEVAAVLPSYTAFLLSLPARDMNEYAGGYKSFVDSRQGLQTFISRQKAAGAASGIMPEDFFGRIEVKEVASALLSAGGHLEKINLVHVGNEDVALIFKGNDVTGLRNYSPAVHSWAYPSFVSSVYGKFFSLADESCFTYVDGWIITGSRTAIEEYVDRNALEYTLEEYLADAGASGIISEKPALALAYFSFTESEDRLGSYFRKDALDALRPWISGCDAAPVVFSLGKDKKELTLHAGLHKLSLQKTKAPSFDRDTVVVVPSGPFKVKNSHTGKMNTFYQNAHKALCLRDENGKDLWGIPFDKSLCGTAANVDYYANGKLQIIFGAGSGIYVIDRLGRYVNGFPLDLGREIALGPDVYDFSGARRYNIMVLHKDNTVQMYNLKGRRPEGWKGITADETIKSLPERLTLGGKDFWIVRTSIQTLIFPFLGGAPLTDFEGDGKIRPDSAVVPVDGTSVQAESYDGKTRTIRLIK